MNGPAASSDCSGIDRPELPVRCTTEMICRKGKRGIDGLSEIKKLVLRSKKILKQNGKLIFEIGEKQLNKVLKLLNENNFYVNRVCKDLNSLPRVIVTTKSP